MKAGGGLTQTSRWRLLTIYPAVKAAASVRSDVESQRGKNSTTHARVYRAVDKDLVACPDKLASMGVHP
jgi:hypothetical protein